MVALIRNFNIQFALGLNPLRLENIHEEVFILSFGALSFVLMF
jgi:hypothetical protein